LTKDTVVILFL